VSSRAKENSDEDFAENFAYFLSNQEVLSSTVPLAYKWILNKFSKDFKLKEECRNASSN
jgi:hypothetical protein